MSFLVCVSSGRVLELAGGELEPELEQLGPSPRPSSSMSSASPRSTTVCFAIRTPPRASMIFALIGSFWMARLRAPRAISSSGYESSNSTRPGLDDGDPALGVALAGAHAGLGRLLRDRLVGEDVDPDLAAALDVAGHGDTGGLDLAGGDPTRLEGLDPVLAVGDGGAALGGALQATAVVLAVLDLAWHQHVSHRPRGGSAASRGARGWSARSLPLRRAGARTRDRPP